MVIELSDEELLEITYIDINCWRYNYTGRSYLDSDNCSSACPNCEWQKECEERKLTPLIKRWNKLKGIKIEKQMLLVPKCQSATK